MTLRTALLLAYALAGAAAVGLALAGRARRLGLVPLSTVLGDVRRSRAGRVVLALVWAWVGWHLLAR